MDLADWGQQVETMLEVIAEGQQKTWESWQGAISALVPDSTDNEGGVDRSGEPSETPLPGASAAAATAGVAEAFFAGYSTMLAMFDMPAMTPSPAKPKSGGAGTEDSPGAIPDAGRLFQQQMMLFPPWAAGQHLLQLLGLSLQEIQKLQRESFQKLAGPWHGVRESGQAPDVDADQSALMKFSGLYWDTFERTFVRLLETPSAGYTRDFEQRSIRSSKAWFEFRSASLDYLLLLGEAGRQALVEFTSELVSMGSQGKTITSLKELLREWTKVADRVMIRTFSSERYARAQGRLLNAAMTYRLEESAAADSILKMSHLPARSEVDGLGREITALRRQLRAVQERESPRTATNAKSKPQAASTGKKAKPKPAKE